MASENLTTIIQNTKHSRVTMHDINTKASFVSISTIDLLILEETSEREIPIKFVEILNKFITICIQLFIKRYPFQTKTKRHMCHSICQAADGAVYQQKRNVTL